MIRQALCVMVLWLFLLPHARAVVTVDYEIPTLFESVRLTGPLPIRVGTNHFHNYLWGSSGLKGGAQIDVMPNDRTNRARINLSIYTSDTRPESDKPMGAPDVVVPLDPTLLPGGGSPVASYFLESDKPYAVVVVSAGDRQIGRTAEYTVTVRNREAIPPERRAEYERGEVNNIRYFDQQFAKIFIDPLKIHVGACGDSNALWNAADDTIYVCVELFMDLFLKGPLQTGYTGPADSLFAILAHEAAHVLLHRAAAAGHDWRDERSADELMVLLTSMLAPSQKDADEQLRGLMFYMELASTSADRNFQRFFGGRHGLNSERIADLRKWWGSSDRDAIMARADKWNRVIFPLIKDGVLKNMLASPNFPENYKAAARTVLMQRRSAKPSMKE